MKWFCAIADVRQKPTAIGTVLTPEFTLIGGLFLILVFTGFLIDKAAAARWASFSTSRDAHSNIEENIVRIAVGAFFLLLWDKGAVVLWERGDAILTPELVGSTAWIGPLQFAIALSVTSRPTGFLAAVGILILLGYGIAQFGSFHMVDYLFFLGLAAYLALTAIRKPWGLRLRTPLLSGSLAFSLMWTAIEKFVYPAWTISVVAEHPNLAFGFSWDFVTVVAGFVEFTLAFYIMTGRGLVRVGAAGYMAIFLMAIPEFGHLDAVGHIPIVAILIVSCMRGAAPLPGFLRISRWSNIANASAVSAIYAFALVGFFSMYYGLQWLEYH